MAVRAVVAALLAASMVTPAWGRPVGQAGGAPVRVATGLPKEIAHLLAPYCWLTDGRVLIVRQSGSGHTRAFVRDVAAGRETLASSVTKLLDGAGAGLTMDLAASPDGRWVLWTNDGEGDAEPGVFGTAVDGSRHFGLRGVPPLAAWLADGSGWLAGEVDDDLRVATVTVRGFDGRARQRCRLRPPLDTGEMWLRSTAVVGEGSRLLLHSLRDTGQGWRLITYVLGPSARRLASRPVSAPPGADCAYVSPDGARAAWLCGHDNPRGPQLWVSRLDGRDARCVLRLGPLRGDEPSELRFTVRWTPGGGGLSYIRGGALWRVPVPPSPGTLQSGRR